MNDVIRSIVIVGGGSAGWMAAALLGRLVRPTIEIVLIESEEIGTVGVGEATIPPIKQFNALVGVDEASFLRDTMGSFKLGIEFVDWGRLGERYMHAFGPIGQQLGLTRLHHYWLAAGGSQAVGPLGKYVINNVAAEQGRFHRGYGDRPSSPLNDIAYAYHFDAKLYALHLRRLAEASGVRRIEGRIVEVCQRPEDGFISELVLDRGERVGGDFFLDCSGFRALLIAEKLGVRFENWSHWLPCDRALAMPSEAADRVPPFTRATAHLAGWQWRIPLQHRTGNGVVYASQALGDDEAASILNANVPERALDEPRLIRFTPGRRAVAWEKNCIAIGLAGGFLEPLESTSLHMVQSALFRLLTLFPTCRHDPAAVAEYNRQSALEYEHVRDFVILHYKSTQRETPFWRECAAMAVPETLQRRLDLFAERGHVARRPDELFAEESWIQVLIGQNVAPRASDPLTALHAPAEISRYLANVRSVISRCVETMPPHEASLPMWPGHGTRTVAARS